MADEQTPALILQKKAGPWRLSAGMLFLGLAAASVALFWRDLSERRTALRALSESKAEPGIELMETVALVDTADRVLALAAEAALPARPQLLGGAAESGPAADTQAVVRRSSAARKLSLDAVAQRPGWMYPRMLLGEAAYGSWLEQTGSGTAVLWARPMALAAADAPGLDSVWITLAEMYLQAWPRLSAEERESALPIFLRAFLSSDFVRRAFPSAMDRLGERAPAVIPARRESLEAAVTLLRAAGREPAASELRRRLEPVIARTPKTGS